MPQMQVHFPAGDEVILQFSHIAAHRDARSHGHKKVQPHDAAIEQPVKMGARRLGERRDHKNRPMMPGTPESRKRATH